MIKQYRWEEYKKLLNEVSPASLFDFHEEEAQVKSIIQQVRLEGDKALQTFSEKFDGISLRDFRVTSGEQEEAKQQVSLSLKEAIKAAESNIRAFHRKQLPLSGWEAEDGVIRGQVYRPLQKAGVYIPGGTAAYPSTVLMAVIPALVAGVEEIYLCTPPGPDGKVNPTTRFTADVLGVSGVFKLGGAHAVAALAFGTETVPRVQKIVGPGNIYVTLAKKAVYGQAGIDMLAGPSEIMVVAGEESHPEYVAADMLSQAEHDPLSRAFLVTDSNILAGEVSRELSTQLEDLPRREVAEKSLREQGAAVLVQEIEEAWEVVNQVAPEHLEIMLPDPWQYLDRVKNAGSIFLGSYTMESIGDYYAGVNHVLPTSGGACFASPLGVHDFLKYSQVLHYSQRSLERDAAHVEELAGEEGLEAHLRAVKKRRK